MIEQTFYKGFEIRRHTFPYQGQRLLLGYSVRKTLPDGSVVAYHAKKAETEKFHKTLFDTELDAKQAIDAGEIVEKREKKSKDESLLFQARKSARR